VVTGNTLDEVEQMGVVPDGYNEYRYDYADEWLDVLYRLWSEKHVNFDGRFFHLSNCVSDPKPRQAPLPAIVSAGTSDEGLRFAAKHSELIFIGNRPPIIAKVKQFAAEAGRSIKVSTNIFLVARKTDAEAEAEYALIQEGVDMEALGNVRGSFDRDNRASTPVRTAYLREPSPVGFGMGVPVVGSPATVARKMVRLIIDQGFDGVQFTFVDYLRDLDVFSREVAPILLQMLAAEGLTANLNCKSGEISRLAEKVGQLT